MAQVQVKVLPGPSGEVVKLNAGGQQLVSGDFSGRDTTTIEIEPDKKVELSVAVEERVVMHGDQFAATKVSVHDPGGERSFAREREEAKKTKAEEDKKTKEELDKKYKEFEKKEDERLGRRRDQQQPQQPPQQPQAATASGAKPAGSGERVAGNVVGSKEVRAGEAPATKPPTPQTSTSPRR